MTQGSTPGGLWLTAWHGVRAHVEAEPDLGTRLARLWAPFLDRAGDATSTVRVEAPDAAAASAALNRAFVHACPYPAVHAGVVAATGGVLAVPAVSGAGKSTLTAALVRAGAGYLSDESLVLRGGTEAGPGGPAPVVLPYPKPVALSPWSAAAVGLPSDGAVTGELMPDGARELLFAAEDLGAVGTAAPLRHLLLPVRDPAGPSLVALPRRDGLAALLALSFNHYRDPRRFLVVAAAAVQGAQVHRLHVGDPRATAELVLERLG